MSFEMERLIGAPHLLSQRRIHHTVSLYTAHRVGKLRGLSRSRSESPVRLREHPRHYRCTPLQQKLREGTCAVPGPRRCPHPPRRRHPGQRWVMVCQPRPRQRTSLQRASRQLQGQGGRETKCSRLEHVRQYKVCAMKCGGAPSHPSDHPTTTIPTLPYTSTDVRPVQPCYIGQTAPHTAFSCGEQVPDVAIPHYRDARMQHSQSR